ncbi:hypothetical protein COCNU_14G007950 [Cocos nucifera]|uniref:Uncharacterized protein n=1 Tax=Cocos nucifera TaxID=13894 RepID=A0A8K0IV75_COCNU|nr:hypothetical protein COCNU_14G007950 [Cocos nucifera]
MGSGLVGKEDRESKRERDGVQSHWCIIQPDISRSHTYGIPVEPLASDNGAGSDMEGDMGKLAKGLYARKRKGAAPSESSKRTKVGDLSFEVSNIPMIAFKVILDVEILSITGGNIEGENPQPPAPSSLPAGGPMPEPLTERAGRVGDDKKKKRAAVTKVVRKACLGGLSDSGGNDLGAHPFDNPKIIWDLIDKFAMSEEVDRLVDLDQM